MRPPLCWNVWLYGFDAVPATSELVEVTTRNCVPRQLTPGDTRGRIIDRTRRTIFRSGFFRIRNLHIEAEIVRPDVYMPYWVFFHGRDDDVRVSVLDAVRGQFEGAKLRHFVRGWLGRT
jgi:hypothetical protein